MKIVCPQCHFSREIPDDKIPENAHLATCPKCQNRFCFRDVEDQYEDVAEMQNNDAESEHFDDYSDINSTRETELQSEKYDQYTAVTKSETDDNADEAYSQKEANHSDRVKIDPADEDQSSEEGDLWHKLGKMVPNVSLQSDSSDNEEEKEEDEYFFEDVPFEYPEKYGFFPALGLTIKRILTSPIKFFTEMPLNGFIKPLVFFLLLAEFQAVFEFFWETLVGINGTVMQDINTTVGTGITQSLSSGSGTAFLNLLLFPVILTIISFPTAGITHLMLLAFGAGKRGFEATYRATTYAYAAAVFSVLPIAGPFITAALSMVISVIAYKHIHNSNYIRVGMAMIAPAVIFLVFAAIYIQFNQPTI